MPSPKKIRPSHFAKRFATGLVTGNADDVASLSGTVAGDLFVFGDIRDVVREGKHLAMGEDTDRLVLGLATAGLAVTAATYVSVGGAAPVRAGLDAGQGCPQGRPAGRGARRMGRPLGARGGRCADAAERGRHRLGVAAAARPSSAIKAAFRAEKAGGLVRLAKDVGRVGEKAGTRGALDTLRIAEGPKDVARAARLAEAKGGQTRAILKLLGRGALLLVGRRVRSGAVAVRRAAGAVRLAVVDQGDDRAADPVLAAIARRRGGCDSRLAAQPLQAALAAAALRHGAISRRCMLPAADLLPQYMELLDAELSQRRR